MPLFLSTQNDTYIPYVEYIWKYTYTHMLIRPCKRTYTRAFLHIYTFTDRNMYHLTFI